MKKSHLIPNTLKEFYALTNINHRTLLTLSNPKIDKNIIPTFGIHLAPNNMSGFNVCKMAFNCKKICLHASGSKLHYSNKIKSRIKKTLAFKTDNNYFLITALINLLDQYKKNNYETIAFRPNLTSDIEYEKIKINIDVSISIFIYDRFNIKISIGQYDNIFQLFLDNGLKIITYDYTKIYRKDNFKYCNKLKYNITYSYDGYSNRVVRLNCLKAIDNNINISACMDYTKKDIIPSSFYSHHLNRTFKVIDGDKTDLRSLDSKNSLVALRFKVPYAFNFTKQDKENFILR